MNEMFIIIMMDDYLFIYLLVEENEDLPQRLPSVHQPSYWNNGRGGRDVDFFFLVKYC